MRKILLLFALPLVPFFFVACSDPQAGAIPPDAGEAPQSASAQESEELPPGHPPLEGASPPQAIAGPPAGSGSGASGLIWTTPDGWQEVQPSSAMRKAQYRVSGEAGDAECVVFYFGPGQGGGAMANALRWADQFSQPDGSSSRERLETEELEVGGIPVLLAEVTGTYSGGMAMMGGPSQELADYMLLGAVVEGPDANWFFKLTGPEPTVAAQRPAFRSMIESVSPGS